MVENISKGVTMLIDSFSKCIAKKILLFVSKEKRRKVVVIEANSQQASMFEESLKTSSWILSLFLRTLDFVVTVVS